jgi:hypothetical protein
MLRLAFCKNPFRGVFLCLMEYGEFDFYDFQVLVGNFYNF